MPPAVANTPEASLWSSGGNVEHELDLWITGFTPSDEPDLIDMGTFANPTATEFGRSQATIECRFRWGTDLVSLLSPLIDLPLLFIGRQNAADTSAVMAHVKFHKLPWGDFNVGESTEVTLTLAVTDAITYATPAAGSGS
jgi:hypothetical protein